MRQKTPGETGCVVSRHRPGALPLGNDRALRHGHPAHQVCRIDPAPKRSRDRIFSATVCSSLFGTPLTDSLRRWKPVCPARINGRRAPLRLPRWRNRLRTASFSLVGAPMPVKAQSLALFLAGGSADMTGWSCPRVLLTQQPHHDLRRCRIMIYAARSYRCWTWTYPMGTSTRSTPLGMR